ncbi:hypothetical protein ACOME3_010811 [Neoechinorhynchus agilis]
MIKHSTKQLLFAIFKLSVKKVVVKIKLRKTWSNQKAECKNYFKFVRIYKHFDLKLSMFKSKDIIVNTEHNKDTTDDKRSRSHKDSKKKQRRQETRVTQIRLRVLD